ncbi:MAG TPA: hypothetical protein DCX32_03370 [Candidatus Moranbacteria bacterium]|nr:MAG: hypothetical protein UW87_C0030G0006 [Candidatus Moranbacteria bacterium GW2011_GWC2_45_10]KKT94544.1 MAG: hypothetical protein UW95_C0013G0008 [Parcubacteria group bacterium GW2011_GWC1_45_14]HAV11559.1 hypothetical protein [Candidatus Moranbacteria bacterium]
MKNILKSFSIIVAIAAVAGGITYAIFSDTDTITGNTVGTATVELDAKGEAASGIVSKPIVATNLVPGEYTDDFRGALHNQSTVDVKLYMYLDNVVGDACDKINLTMTTGHAGGDEYARTILNNVALSSIDTPAERVEITGVPPFETAGPNITQVVRERAQLDPSADNTYQNKTCTWDEVFVAESIAP